MNDIAQVFSYTGREVRTLLVEDAPWFVATDVCTVLGIANARQAVSYLDDDEVQQAPVISNDGSGRELPTNLINEPGLYSLILRSRKPEAKAFKRWVTHEVLPAIRTTGSYSATAEATVAAISRRELAVMVVEAEDRASAAEQQLAVATPKADAWDHLASAVGDYSVADAAKILSRHPLIQVGQSRLFTLLSGFGWTYRRQVDNRWTVYQRAVDCGWVTELASSHYHPRTGELVLDAPQVRITAKGLESLHRRLTGVQTAIAAAPH